MLPPVASTIVIPGRRMPRHSASSINATPRRSFTLPHGLRISSLATTRPGSPLARRRSSTRGVLPTVRETSPAITGCASTCVGLMPRGPARAEVHASHSPLNTMTA